MEITITVPDYDVKQVGMEILADKTGDDLSDDKIIEAGKKFAQEIIDRYYSVEYVGET